GYDGIRVRDGNTGNLIRGNSIFRNGNNVITSLGIDLGVNGFDTNDHCDGDTGGNMLQNYPVLTNSQSGGHTTKIEGVLDSAASTTFLVQFYVNTALANQGYGEGETYLGSINVTTTASCSNNFSAILPVGVTTGLYITATATDPNNNTSEFSLGRAV